jgi:hypothetical protein
MTLRYSRHPDNQDVVLVHRSEPRCAVVQEHQVEMISAPVPKCLYFAAFALEDRYWVEVGSALRTLCENVWASKVAEKCAIDCAFAAMAGLAIVPAPWRAPERELVPALALAQGRALAHERALEHERVLVPANAPATATGPGPGFGPVAAPAHVTDHVTRTATPPGLAFDPAGKERHAYLRSQRLVPSSNP